MDELLITVEREQRLGRRTPIRPCAVRQYIGEELLAVGGIDGGVVQRHLVRRNGPEDVLGHLQRQTVLARVRGVEAMVINAQVPQRILLGANLGMQILAADVHQSLVERRTGLVSVIGHARDPGDRLVVFHPMEDGGVETQRFRDHQVAAGQRLPVPVW